MFGIGGFELVIILIFAFLVLGPERLPEAAKTLGKAIAKFRSFQDEMTSVVKNEIKDTETQRLIENPYAQIEKFKNDTLNPAKEEKLAGLNSEQREKYQKYQALKERLEAKQEQESHTEDAASSQDKTETQDKERA